MSRVHRVVATIAAGALGGALLSGCSRNELTPAEDLVPSAPWLFATGVGVAVSGVPSADQTPNGPLWWFTAPESSLAVYNGSDRAATLRVRGLLVVPCGTPASIELTLPDGHRRVAKASAGEQTPVMFTVDVAARSQVEVAASVEGEPCHPGSEARTLYAGLLGLRAEPPGAGAAGTPLAE